MANIISEYYSEYVGTKEKFETFHNNVINMPRANFSELDDTIKLLKCLASYIMLIDKDILTDTINYKTIYHEIFKNYKNGIIPEQNRDLEFERRYLDRTESFDFLYGDEGKNGRMFRHYMEYFAFFNIFKNGTNSRNKRIDIESLEELLLTPDDVLFDVFRNKILNINIKDNDFIKNLQGIEISANADYRPARAIISYCKEMNRPVTVFEIAILLGRVDSLQDEKSIIHRAITIGKQLPRTKEDQQKQIFGCMGWKSGNILFQYSQSQNPDFKFNVFLLFMNTFGLIEYNDSTKLITLTDYSTELIGEDIAFEVLDLEKLLVMIDDDSEDSNKLSDIIIRKRTETITKAILDDGELVVKLNQRNIRNPIIKRGKRVRNKLIAEVAKIKANYLDEVTLRPTFEGKNGKNYIEAHHIIEFSGENGPDITDNLICLGPQNHSLIHHGSSNAVDDFYTTCQSRGVLTFDRFKGMCTKYRCLTTEHVKVLLSKKIISKTDAEELNELIALNGVDQDFLDSLNTPADNI